MFLTGSDFREGGAPDVVSVHAAAKKLLLQLSPLGLRWTDLWGGLGFAQLLSLPGGPLGRGFPGAPSAQEAVLQAGAELAHGLAQPGHEQDGAEAGRGRAQLGADRRQDVANAGHAGFAQSFLHRRRVRVAVKQRGVRGSTGRRRGRDGVGSCREQKSTWRSADPTYSEVC